MMMARPAAKPAASVATRRSNVRSASESDHQAVAGTSLMASSDCPRKVGLVASSSAAPAPTPWPASREPIRYVAHTAAPLESGTTRNTAARPARRSKSAIISGRPGA